MSKEAMTKAIEVLKKCHYYMIDAGLPNQSMLIDAFTAYKALEDALAEQPAPMSEFNRVISYAAAMKLRELGYEWMNDEWKHLDELAEQPAQQEPVRLQCTTCGTVYADGVPPQVAQPAREWVGLTDEQISAIGSKIFPSTWNIRHIEFARAIEAALGITKGNT